MSHINPLACFSILFLFLGFSRKKGNTTKSMKEILTFTNSNNNIQVANSSALGNTGLCVTVHSTNMFRDIRCNHIMNIMNLWMSMGHFFFQPHEDSFGVLVNGIQVVFMQCRRKVLNCWEVQIFRVSK